MATGCGIGGGCSSTDSAVAYYPTEEDYYDRGQFTAGVGTPICEDVIGMEMPGLDMGTSEATDMMMVGVDCVGMTNAQGDPENDLVDGDNNCGGMMDGQDDELGLHFNLGVDVMSGQPESGDIIRGNCESAGLGHVDGENSSCCANVNSRPDTQAGRSADNTDGSALGNSDNNSNTGRNHFGRNNSPDRQVGSAMDDSHKNPNKVFIGGLGVDTTTWRLRSYMRQFGRIVDVAVLQNKLTGKSRCFGFCSFADAAAVEKCMSQKHKIDGVPVDVRRALPRTDASLQHYPDDFQNSKIFVGRLPMDTTEAQLADLFEQYGKVKSVVIMYDKVTNKQRGFAFVTFETPEEAERALGEHSFLDGTIEAMKATPREVLPSSRNRRQRELNDYYYRQPRYGGYRHSPVSYRRNGYYDDRDYAPYGYGYGGGGPRFPYYSGPMYGGDMHPSHSPGAGSGMYYNEHGGVVGGCHDYGYDGPMYWESTMRQDKFDSRRSGHPNMGMAGGGVGGRCPWSMGNSFRTWRHVPGGGSRGHPY